MNLKLYLERILALCTDKQRNLYDRMYPDGATGTQIKRAIQQVETTLKSRDGTIEILREDKKNLNVAIHGWIISKNVAEKESQRLEIELIEAEELIKRLQNPINIENNDVQEKLDRLDALEAAGVDNWDGYDYAMGEFRDECF